MVQCIVDMELIIVNAIQISLKHLTTYIVITAKTRKLSFQFDLF